MCRGRDFLVKLNKIYAMSTLAYASLTTAREAAAPHTSTTQSPGVGTYIDAFAALVPAEVLTLHAVIISYTTRTVDKKTFILPEGWNTLQVSFWGLIVTSMVLYAGARLIKRASAPGAVVSSDSLPECRAEGLSRGRDSPAPAPGRAC